MNKLLKLTDYNNPRKDIDRFRHDLIDIVGDEIFTYETNDDLIFGFLNHISSIKKHLKNTEKSIELNCYKVLKHFSMQREAQIFSLDYNGKTELNSSNKQKSSKIKILDTLFRFKSPPKDEYIRIRAKVYKDLQEKTRLVNYYSSQLAVQNFLNEKGKINTHSDRMVVDYYKRCYDAQQIILDYYLGQKLKDRAISNVTKTIINLPNIKWLDYPYFFQNYSIGYFDHRQIDKSTHRFDGIIAEDDFDEKMLKIYDVNKSKYYRLLFSILPVSKILSDINYYLELLPLSNDRKVIIKELIYLFKKKRWVSFYGISLSQVEGLFLDMLDAADIEKNRTALSQKVQALREQYILSDFYFDYFQYHIPILRNKFMHGALNGDEGNKLNSYDFLTDIRFLLIAFSELRNPLVKLQNILFTNNFNFNSIDDVSTFITLVNSLNPKRKSELWQSIQKFFNINLIENKSLEAILYNIKDDLEEDISSIFEQINKIFHDKDFNIYDVNVNVIKDFLLIQENGETLNDNFYLYESKVNKLSNYNIFYKNYSKYILENNTKLFIESIFKHQKENLNKIHTINSFL